MLRQGRSWSGRERNCCFLNTGNLPAAASRFANVSASSGLDFPDDGRAVAVTDWDHDGDLDLWISNRTAPRLRLMMNNSPAKNNWVSLRLVGNGTTTSRDAIGARVEVIVNTPHSEFSGTREVPRSIKTLRAGEGFVAQSSKWLHFGLGAADELDKILVHWPGGQMEMFTGLAVARRYTLVQGSGRSEESPEGPRVIKLDPSKVIVPRASDRARIPLSMLLPVPPLTIKTSQGTVVTGTGRPVLVNLWASYCRPCLQELRELARREQEIRAVGIEVVAANVDGITDPGASSAPMAELLARLDFPFHATTFGTTALKSLQANHDLIVPLDRPLPLPSSFLFDAQGRLSVIYKGPVTVDDLLADVRHASRPFHERWVSAAQFPASAIDDVRLAHVATGHAVMFYLQRAGSLAQNGHHDRAARYIQEALNIAPEEPQAHAQFAEVLTNIGRPRAAIEHYRQALRLSTDKVYAANNLAWLLATAQDPPAAEREEALHWARHAAAATNYEDPNKLDTLAAAYAASGQFDQAIATAKDSIGICRELGQDELAREIQERLDVYRLGRPYVDATSSELQ